jgi:AraC-like DNA-binding protein
MSYNEYNPSQRLEGIIDSFWSFEDIATGTQRILPDGCMDIIFTTDTNARQPVFISGMMTTFSDVSFDIPTSLFGVRFKPGQLGRITNFPLFELKNESADAQEIVPQITPDTLDQMTSFTTDAGKKAFMEHAIVQLLASKDKNTYITSLINHILASPCPVNVNELVNGLPVSIRQLERTFKAQVGVTLKEFCSINRFNKAKRDIKRNPNKSLLDIAFDHGYYDHSHLTNEFKKLSGSAPSLFR